MLNLNGCAKLWRGEDIDGKLRVEPRETRAITKYQEKLEALSSSAQEIQDLASGQQTLPKPPEPSILERVQTAVSTNTEMLRQAVSDTPCRGDGGTIL